jgi:hypothetical protein
MIGIRTRLGDARQRKFVFKNTSGEQIPGFAVMKVTDTINGVIQVGKPDTDNDTCSIVINDGSAVNDQKYGVCFYPGAQPLFIKCHSFTSGVCGVKSGQWYLDNTMAGFNAIGKDANGYQPLVVKCL